MSVRAAYARVLVGRLEESYCSGFSGGLLEFRYCYFSSTCDTAFELW